MQQASHALQQAERFVEASNPPLPHHHSGEFRPFPFDPLADFVAPPGGYVEQPGIGDESGRVTSLAMKLGVDRNQVYRWKTTGLSPAMADALAVKFGVHPALIWPEWFALAPTEEELAWLERREMRRQWRRRGRRRAPQLRTQKVAS